jgi:hypothetical protein
MLELTENSAQSPKADIPEGKVVDLYPARSRFEKTLDSMLSQVAMSAQDERLVHYFILRSAATILSLVETGEAARQNLSQHIPLVGEEKMLQQVGDKIRLGVNDHYDLVCQPNLPIGEVVKAWRKYRGIKGFQMSKDAGLHYTYGSKLERGSIEEPSLDALTSIASVLNLEVEDLLVHRVPVLLAEKISKISQ